MSRITIESGSPAMEWLRDAVRQPRGDGAIHINPAPGGLQFKRSYATWTKPLSTSAPVEDQDVRRSHRHTECGHLVCDGCGGHISYEESNEEHTPEVISCYCCKHCGARGGH